MTVGNLPPAHRHRRQPEREYAHLYPRLHQQRRRHEGDLVVLTGRGLLGFIDIGYRNQTFQLKVIVDYQYLLNSILVQQNADFIGIGPLFTVTSRS